MLEDHCYNLDANESFIQEKLTPTQIEKICFRKDVKSYEVAAYSFVAWHVSITAMALEKVNFMIWFKEDSITLFVSCKFASVKEALNFHHEIYEDRMYNVHTSHRKSNIRRWLYVLRIVTNEYSSFLFNPNRCDNRVTTTKGVAKLVQNIYPKFSYSIQVESTYSSVEISTIRANP